jgi:hypothetical protein
VPWDCKLEDGHEEIGRLKICCRWVEYKQRNLEISCHTHNQDELRQLQKESPAQCSYQDKSINTES